MRLLSTFLLGSLFFVGVLPAAGLETVYVVRHLQKDRRWTGPDVLRPLNEKGAVCAEALAAMLSDAGIAAVYSTEAARTLATGAAVSSRLDGAAIAGDNRLARLSADSLESLRDRHADDRAVLFVGHSNTVTDIVLAFHAEADGCRDELGLAKRNSDESKEGLDEKQYGDVWRIHLGAAPACAGGVTRLRIDAADKNCLRP